MSIPKLLLYRLPADFHERLENWGAVMRDRPSFSVSPTYQVCQELARRAGKLPRGDDSENLRPEKDEADAELIEACWRTAAAYRGLPRETALLRAYYVLRQPPAIICRMQGMRVREFDDVLVRAVLEFQAYLAKFVSRVHNPPQSVMTTV
ncbi:hypothetical protein N5C72_07640 [Achromobacter mucicolens]|uniref:Uncharacterized protein n=2 Tax=Achromobacter TaxID=222 RepID=A0ABD4YR75_9BURK|nr:MULTISPECIES: hypothetical protein [Achromobacter]MDH1177942.1 hypothetical protein [Achromobacter mucicolens]QKQ46810.1 hypothetical protein FOC81_08950 [Achromobacter denitrificans]